MENKNKVIIYITISAIILIVCIQSIVIVYSNHVDKKYLSLNKKIEEAALTCYRENKCQKKVNIQELYDQEYLQTQVDPMTKKLITNDLTITIKDNKASIDKSLKNS